MDTLFSDAVEKMFSQIATPAIVRGIDDGGSPQAMWNEIEACGFLDALVPEALGGAGLTLSEVFPTFLAAGYHALPVPFIQTILGRALLAAAQISPVSGPITFAGHGELCRDGSGISGRLPFAQPSAWVLADLDGGMVLLPVQDSRIDPVPGPNLCVGIQWAHVPTSCIKVASTGEPGLVIKDLAAVAYSALMAGAGARVLEMTLKYANQRTQFGKSIGKFQAVQNQVSILAERVAAVRMAAQLACQGGHNLPRPLLAAMGKQQASESAALIADIGHAVHGAIGITQEYDLQLYTRRLRLWRLAAGGASYWAQGIGSALIQRQDQTALAFICRELSSGQI